MVLAGTSDIVRRRLIATAYIQSLMRADSAQLEKLPLIIWKWLGIDPLIRFCLSNKEWSNDNKKRVWGYKNKRGGLMPCVGLYAAAKNLRRLISVC